MKQENLPLAANYFTMKKEALRLLKDIDAGKELNPATIVSMFPWKDSVSVLRSLLERRVAECNTKLDELAKTKE